MFYFVTELPHGMLTPLKNFSERSSVIIMKSDLLTAHNTVVMTTPLSTVFLQLVVFEFLVLKSCQCPNMEVCGFYTGANVI